MNLIASYRNKGFESVADGVMSFFDRRTDLHRNGIAFSNGSNNDSDPAKISTDISLVAIDRTDLEAFALSEVIVRGVDAGLKKYLQDRPLFTQCSPEQSLFVNPIFNIQRYAPGEGFKKWHCDWTISITISRYIIITVMNLKQLSKGNVLVFGDVILDRYISGTVDRVSPEAPVPVLKPSKEDVRLGGAANVALNLSSLGSKATLIGVPILLEF